MVGSTPTNATKFEASPSIGFGPLTFNQVIVSSTLTDATNFMDPFVVTCFAIPIVLTAYSMVKAKGYIEGRAEAERDMPQLPRRLGMKKPMQRKRLPNTWTQKDGKVIKIADMTDSHLANSIKLIAREWNDTVSDFTSDTNYKALTKEAEKRGFNITILTSPIQTNGREEYVLIIIPAESSKIAAGLFPTDWDSREDQ